MALFGSSPSSPGIFQYNSGTSSSTDAAIAAGLSGASAGSNGYTPGTNPLTDSGTNPSTPGTDTNGAEQVQVTGQNNKSLGYVSLYPSVSGNDVISRPGTMTIHEPIDFTGQGDLREGGASKATTVPKSSTVADTIQEFGTWDSTQYNTFRQQAYQAGLISSKNAGTAEVLGAWQTVVEEASKENKTPESLITQAAANGWSSLNPTIQPADHGLGGSGNINNSPDQAQTQTQTSYISYLDPATVQGTLADAYYRLLGRNPTSAEYQAFLNSVYSYEDQANTGKFEDSTTDKTNAGPTSGASSNVQQNIVSQRGIGTRGAQFLAGQDAMSNPEEGQYQAATTYFNAFMKALTGPAAGMQASGPTNTAP